MVLDRSFLAFGLVIATSLLWKKRREAAQEEDASPEVTRFRSLLASGQLVHPYRRAEHFQQDITSIAKDDCVASFTDFASALACCCGANVSDKAEKHTFRDQLVRDIGTRTRHIIVILCDGMGNSILEQHLPQTAFLRHRNQSDRLRAVFPSTTPAALTTLATAQWPGQHGVPGWDLREQQRCEYPGEASSLVQLRILAPRIMNVRSNEPADYASFDDVFLVPPWSRSLQKTCERRMTYINAYNPDNKGETARGSDFSSWQAGLTSETTVSPFDLATIGETAFLTLGEPEGSHTALSYFRDGVDKALGTIAKAEASSQSTFTYLYSAHPDKHMHALGTDHSEVHAVVNGINDEIERLWNLLGDRYKLLSKYNVTLCDPESTPSRIDACVVVTADHGHVSVHPEDMLVLSDDILECLEYANVGVHGKVCDVFYVLCGLAVICTHDFALRQSLQGRHAFLHCKAGLQTTLRQRWRACRELQDAFVLLSIEEAIDNDLFGPVPPILKVRPRLGDFVAISVSRCTLVSPKECMEHKNHCQGAHGSLLGEEMRIPFILCSPSQD